ncbi:copper chaperone PCu(A)C [Luteibacter sp. 3190]|uniref:copper chaperone PCu(A)C n=1 Tax=Luteibacter sp. 3190 TaxID=2817736 RepID=UPI00285DAD6E|nr:copper chaperone PCu(A)C [Luteibacter sp. 3190]MDR6934842.1 copper(I)-binding protein [Luteibacter sp. 3190]
MMVRTIAAALLLAAGAAHATDTVRASGAWIRVLPGNLPAGGYATFENPGDGKVSITDATSADYGEAMIHRSSTETGMGRMEMVDEVPVPARGKVAFSPGGYHVMLMNPKHPVKPGDTVVVTFTLSDGSTLAVPFLARPANAKGLDD